MSAPTGEPAKPGGTGKTGRAKSGAGRTGAGPVQRGPAGAAKDEGRDSRPGRVMPGGAEAIRAERLAARKAEPAPEPDSGVLQGLGVLRSAWVGTALFTVTAAAAAVIPAVRIVAVLVDLLFLLAGSGMYFWGWAVAAGRSRDSEISLWNLILLEDVAPKPVRVWLLGALGVQITVAAATCWITAPLAFGWLVPMWGLAHCEYWGARYGMFLPRKAEETPKRRRR